MKETKRLGGKIVFMGGTDKQNEKFAEAFMKHLPQGLADAELREQKKEEATIRRWEREAEKKKLNKMRVEQRIINGQALWLVIRIEDNEIIKKYVNEQQATTYANSF